MTIGTDSLQLMILQHYKSVKAVCIQDKPYFEVWIFSWVVTCGMALFCKGKQWQQVTASSQPGNHKRKHSILCAVLLNCDALSSYSLT
jgi:hypothetical protein